MNAQSTLKIFAPVKGLRPVGSLQITSSGYNFRCITDHSEKLKLLRKSFRQWCGHQDSITLESGPFFYSEAPLDARKALELDTNINFYTLLLASELRHRLHLLWALKDNSVDISTFFIQVVSPTRHIALRKSMTNLRLNATGELDCADFAQEDLAKTARFHILMESDEKSFTSGGTVSSSIESGAFARSVAIRGSVRFIRFWQFIDWARSTGDLTLKTLHYCAALECLLATRDEGSKERYTPMKTLSIRVAKILGRDRSDQDRIANNLRPVYEFRNKFVHGSEVDVSSLDNLKQASVTIDSYARRIADFYISTPEFQAATLSKNSLHGYLTKFD